LWWENSGMLKNDLSDTIAAIATPVGEGGIGIVRISGARALFVAEKIFISKSKGKPSGFKSYTVHYGWIVDKTNVVDEVILTVMRAPKTYTREDVVEINCHGGIIALRRVLELALENGCRLAAPGEFTKRAFLNGRIDLTQAEAVLDIIRAKTDFSLKISLEQLKGVLSVQINKLRRNLLDVLSVLEANIDFPEEEIDPANLDSIVKKLSGFYNELSKMLDNANRAKIFREGIHTVICGKPNVGKSSLLNALLKQERSIVTSVAGTTRDTIEEIIDIKGIPVRIVDTAGLLEPRDLIEKKAVARSRQQIGLADLVIIVFDGSRKLSRDDQMLIRRLKSKMAIAVVNKIDLKQKADVVKLGREFKHILKISAKSSKNLGLLEEKIAELAYSGAVSSHEPVMVSNLRHISLLREAQKLLAHSLDSLDNKLSLEYIAQDIKEALVFLDDILGKSFSEDLLDKIFAEFCIGK
jgi:tRNA modification GTPase